MINFLKRFMSKKKASPLYVKLKSALHRESNRVEINEAFYLGGEKYSKKSFNELLEFFENRKSLEELHPLEYKNDSDNLELYIVRDDKKKWFVIFLYDPYEVYQAEQVLKILSIKENQLKGVEGTLQVFPST